MLLIDGSRGEGGGQIVRSSLALSLVTGQPITIDNVRAGRRKPGLQPQHLQAVRAAREISGADVEGDRLGSTWLRFDPGPVRPGEYRFAIGTAGSTTLVLQTVLPALMIAEQTSTVYLEGGTHNPLAPPVDFLTKTYLPLLERMGPAVEVSACRLGFYPAGGGSFQVRIRPQSTLHRFELLERGRLRRQQAQALVANLPLHIAQRECRTLARHLSWDENCCLPVEVPDARGPGNVVLIELEYEQVTEVIAGFGAKGKPAEVVALQAARDAQRYLEGTAPVGEHLADQLLLPLAISASQSEGGGVYRAITISRHTSTQIDLVQRFLPIEIGVVQNADGSYNLSASRFAE